MASTGEQRAMARVADLMNRSPVTVSRGWTLREVAKHLTLHDASGAPVCDRSGRVVGMVSKTDIVDRLADHGDLLSATVEDVMCVEIFSVSPEASAVEAAERMVFEGVHRLVVLGDEGELAGVVSSLDLLKAFVEAAQPRR
jgi:CBS domain-containing protein